MSEPAVTSDALPEAPPPSPDALTPEERNALRMLRTFAHNAGLVKAEAAEAQRCLSIIEQAKRLHLLKVDETALRSVITKLLK